MGDEGATTTNMPSGQKNAPADNTQAPKQPQKLISFTKETTPTASGNLTAQKKQPVKPRIKNSVGYSFAGNSLAKNFKATFPKEMIPSKITGYLMLSFFLLALVLALVQFPLGKMLSGKTDVTIEVGYPWPFLTMELMDPTKSPLSISGLLLDILLYALLGYIIEVAFNFFMSSPFMKSRKERAVMPKWFRNFSKKKKEKEKEIVGSYQQNTQATQQPAPGTVQQPAQTKPVTDTSKISYKSI